MIYRNEILRHFLFPSLESFWCSFSKVGKYVIWSEGGIIFRKHMVMIWTIVLEIKSKAPYPQQNFSSYRWYSRTKCLFILHWLQIICKCMHWLDKQLLHFHDLHSHVKYFSLDNICLKLISSTCSYYWFCCSNSIFCGYASCFQLLHWLEMIVKNCDISLQEQLFFYANSSGMFLLWAAWPGSAWPAGGRKINSHSWHGRTHPVN